MPGYPHLLQIQDPHARAALKQIFDRLNPQPAQVTSLREDALLPSTLAGQPVLSGKASRLVDLLDAREPDDAVTRRQLATDIQAAGGDLDFVKGPVPAVAGAGNVAAWDGVDGRRVKDWGSLPSDVPELIVRRDFTNTELINLFGTPILLVAGIAGSIHIPIAWMISLRILTVFTNSRSFELDWVGTNLSGVGNVSPTWTTTGVKRGLEFGNAVDFTIGSFDPRGTGLEITLNGAPTGAGDAKGSVVLWYYTISIVQP